MISVYDGEGNQKHVSLFGTDVFGKYIPGNGYYYFVKDHLGSTRVVVDEFGDVVEAYDYYPFGKVLRSYINADETDEKFTGKELDNDNDERLYYFGARYYDGDLGRWLSVDPLAHLNPGQSPYNYVTNNPLSRVDPDGMDDIYYDANGNEIDRERTGFWSFDWLLGDDHYVSNSEGNITFKDNQYLQANGEETIERIKQYAGELNIDMNFAGGKFSELVANANSKPTDIYRVLQESVGGDLDFKLQLNKSTIYLFDNKLYNSNEAGNIIWSYFLMDNGFGSLLGQGLAEGGSAKDYIFGKRPKYLLDEPWDRRARKVGRDYWRRVNR